MNYRDRENTAIANLENAGWRHQYTYNPDGRKRRHVFSVPDTADASSINGTRIVFGFRELEELAARHGKEQR